uniref:Chromosome 11 open reading frame 71 n=1 Tax=Catagonus wagneri TaxID=51154 RepID=A0A8C3YQT8_9CETA
MALPSGDQGNGSGYHAFRGDLSSAALALAMVSGDSFLVTRPEAVLPELARPALRPNVRTGSRRAPGGGRSPARVTRGRQPGFAPYAAPARKLDLLGRVLRQRLAALGGVLAARLSAGL